MLKFAANVLGKRALIALGVLALTGCVTGTHSSKREVSAANRSTWTPAAPSSLGSSLSASQILRVAFGEREATLNCVVSVTPQQLTIIGVTALGLRAFTVKFDGVHIAAEAQAAVPQILQPERLLNDLQLVYWPLSVLQKTFVGTPWKVSEPAPGTRRLRYDDRIMSEVHYTSADPWVGRAWLVNLDFGYTLSIDSQRLESTADSPKDSPVNR